MPTYEYACRACGQHLEVVQSFSDDALTTCESCGGELRKVFSAAGLIFKGSGWHIKDYSSGSGTSSSTSSSGSGSGSSTGSGSSSSASSTSSPASGSSGSTSSSGGSSGSASSTD